MPGGAAMQCLLLLLAAGLLPGLGARLAEQEGRVVRAAEVGTETDLEPEDAEEAEEVPEADVEPEAERELEHEESGSGSEEDGVVGLEENGEGPGSEEANGEEGGDSGSGSEEDTEAEPEVEPEPEAEPRAEAEPAIEDGSVAEEVEEDSGSGSEEQTEAKEEPEAEAEPEAEVDQEAEETAERSVDPEVESDPEADSGSGSVPSEPEPAPMCEASLHGCCPGTELPGHGPGGEGCCLSSPAGCCPDSVRDAAGPSGCGCLESPLGCCMDGVTARQDGDRGCGCQETEHGCCQDQYTAAAGPELAGCPCGTSEHGCCEDGETAAAGPAGEGCPGCGASEHGCCPDTFTPAAGPGGEGCGCAGSEHGCCPDGVLAATGDDFDGCEERPGEACHLSKDGGTGENFTVLWFYDTNEGRCSRFWYGGEGGNKNAFATADDCEAICISPPGSAMCYLPKAPGICMGHSTMWHYDTKYKQCNAFTYGGCLGNANRFPGREACERTCVRSASLSVCQQPLNPGPCRAEEPRWYFNDQLGRCSNFTYGGCQGNKNRFMSEEACRNSCGHQARAMETARTCKQPVSVGSCNGTEARWAFSEQARDCVPFYYSGCQGNKNNFETRVECQQTCPNAFPPELEAVHKILNIENGSEALLRINVSGNPFPEISWQHGEQAVEWDDRVELRKDLSVRIAAVVIADAGTWTVTARNGLGQVVRRQISLTVYPSSIPLTVSIPVDSPAHYEAGEEIVMACEVEGYPVPTVAWLKNNAKLPRSNRILVRDETTLVIKRASPIDGGSYSCRAENRDGWQQAVVEVTVEQGEIPVECTDTPGLANCAMVVRRKQCGRSPALQRICCQSCHAAGHIAGPPAR